MRLQEDRHSLVTDNMGLVHSHALKMARANRDAALDYEDFYSAGCMGLIHAAARYEESSGLKFSTYATQCIAGFIKRHKNQNTPIRVSMHVAELATAMIKHRMTKATDEEIIARFKVPASRIESAREYLRWLVVSADSPSPEDPEVTFGDLFRGSENDLTQPHVDEFMKTLTEREQLIVECLMIGLQFREIAPLVGVTYQRIGQQTIDIRNKWIGFDTNTKPVRRRH
ncbi:sigma-70 family RNA polymerase sigma factor [Paenibacillus sp. MMO-58]|uniref:sigma-70 family RNA polymerase sigma factor n=1 Tax=Paenibacillus sp. MMO-58 TaxID=3081290 RepID=UPI0030161467